MNLPALAKAPDRVSLWAKYLNETGAEVVAEVGVWKGEFAESILRLCPGIRRYYLIDPWAHLDDWRKPFNVSDDQFESIRAEALRRTDFAADRRVVLRGRTSDVAAQIPDGSLDWAYIDGDHTLRGITLDLHHVFPKLRAGGGIGGDDFVHQQDQHGHDFDPTLVFPYAVYFAEAMGRPIHALPANQFLIQNDPEVGFAFHDWTETYRDLSVRRPTSSGPSLRSALKTLAKALLRRR